MFPLLKHRQANRVFIGIPEVEPSFKGEEVLEKGPPAYRRASVRLIYSKLELRIGRAAG